MLLYDASNALFMIYCHHKSAFMVSQTAQCALSDGGETPKQHAVSAYNLL